MYEYDDGRLARAVTTREPEWTEHDQAAIIALTRYRDSLCDCCGLPKAQVWAHERDAPRLVVKKWPCLARRTLIESQLALSNNGKDQKPAHAALRWSIRVKT